LTTADRLLPASRRPGEKGGDPLLIGILSDSHGRYPAVRRAIAHFDSLGVAYLIHCGDVGGTEVFDELAGRPCTFVWGNTDDPDNALDVYLKTVGLPVPAKVPVIVELGGKRFAVFHGHERSFRNAPYTMEVDYILHGHTHQPRDQRQNGTRIINPGALCRANPRTVATLETETDELTFHEIEQRP